VSSVREGRKEGTALDTRGFHTDDPHPDRPHELLRRTLFPLAVVFSLSYLILFLGMSREPNVYDEGLVLTAAMRVAAGQIPHRDFYANYGPAQFYILAGLFKTFGESLFVERLYDLCIKALVVTSVYAILLAYCRKSVAAITAVAAMLWIISVNNLSGTPVIPVSLLNLLALGLVLPVFWRAVSTTRMLAAGAVAGTAALFRYDTGVALLGIETCVIAVAIFFWRAEKSLRVLLSTLAPCFAAFAGVVLPFALYYLSVAPLHAIVYDILLYPAKYYHRGRNLPLPAISLKYFQNFEVYLLIPLIGVALYVAVAGRFRSRQLGVDETPGEPRWQGFLVTFGLLALVMYFKGIVRMEIPQMYLCIIPSLLLAAVLFEQRLAFSRPLRFSVVGLVSLSVLTVTFAILHEIKRLQIYHFSVPERLVESLTGTASDIEAEWCQTSNALTRGFCFLADDERIQAVEFIDSHTAPGQRLYVGLPKHDRIFANDNLTYFATQRLPATMWSHFDPGLQNSYAIQAQMVRELQAAAPPYIVLDAEWDTWREPNDSAVSTGVTLLDDYLHKTYQPTTSFGTISIFQRIPSGSTQ
jgi:hypothetical protein